MPNFDVQLEGTTVAQWTDPAWAPPGDEPVRPSRLNPRHGTTHMRHTARSGDILKLRAVVSGVVSPPDTALGGELFSVWLVQGPVEMLPTEEAPGRSSLQILRPVSPGHYVIGMGRRNGGAVLVPFDIF